MHLEPWVAVAGLVVGFTVGLTGMGGGALMTPILVLIFHVEPLAAVSSDLVAAMVMKPVGGAVHLRQGTVKKHLVAWLCVGSVPAAFGGVLILRAMGGGVAFQDRLKIVLGVALVLAAASIVLKTYLTERRLSQHRARIAAGVSDELPASRPFRVRPVVTVLVGVAGGLFVGMSSVGSGSLIIVALMLLYPMLSTRELVGTDLVQAIPLVFAAALGHILFGQFEMGLTASMLLGSIPGVYLGARLSSRAPDGVIRPILAFVLLASGLKLLGVGTGQLGAALFVALLLLPPIYGMVDAAARSERDWTGARRSKRFWIILQGAGAPFGVGLAAAIAYFARIRPALVAAALRSHVAVWGDEMAT